MQKRKVLSFGGTYRSKGQGRQVMARHRQTGKEEIKEKPIKKMKETHRVMSPEDQNRVTGY